MLSRVITASLVGIEGSLVIVETDLTRGLPAFNLVGLGDRVIKESGERIRSAIINSGLIYPQDRITINLSPANTKKNGSHFDLPIAIGIVSAKEKDLKVDDIKYAIFGELCLDGEVKAILGALPLAICAKENGATDIIVPKDNADEVAILEGVNVYPVSTLRETIDFLAGKINIKKHIYKGRKNDEDVYEEDFSEVLGQEFAKRAIVIAAAGGHNILMMGAPGVGKSMLAKRMRTIMPDLTYEERLEVTKIHSVAGIINGEIIRERPFRAPHNTITSSALFGGGNHPSPGEISLAHNGILFLDEMIQFEARIINQLRQPLEMGEIVISRQYGSAVFPAKFLLVVATNPCKCGYYGDESHGCTCSFNEINNYQAKLSGPLIDRIDLHIKLSRAKYEETVTKDGLDSKTMKEMVVSAREIQKKRYKDEKIITNGQLDGGLIKKYCHLNLKEKQLMEKAYKNLKLSMRSYNKIIKIARTIADLRGAEEIQEADILEALQYRGLDELYRRK